MSKSCSMIWNSDGEIFFKLFLAALGLRCFVQAFSSCGMRASHGGSPSDCKAQAVVYRLSNCGTQAQLPHGMCNLPRPWIKLMSPAMSGWFLTAGPPGKSLNEICLSGMIILDHPDRPKGIAKVLVKGRQEGWRRWKKEWWRKQSLELSTLQRK